MHQLALERMEPGEAELYLFLSHDRVELWLPGEQQSRLVIRQGDNLYPEVGLIYLLDPLPLVNKIDQFLVCMK